MQQNAFYIFYYTIDDIWLKSTEKQAMFESVTVKKAQLSSAISIL